MSEPVKNFVIGAVRQVDTPAPVAPRNFTIGAAKPVAVVAPVVEPVIELSLEDEEAALLAKLREVQQRREAKEVAERAARFEAEEARRKAELTKPIIVSVKAFSGAMVITEGDYREDVVNYFRTIPTRMYRGSQQNSFPVGEWTGIAEHLKSMPDVTLLYAEGVEEAITHHLFAPVWTVDLESRFIKLTPGPRYNSYDVNKIPGLEWVALKKYFSCPLTEGWRLYKSLEKVEGVLYSDECKDFILKQVESRGRLDEIGMAKDWDYPVDLNGVILRPFQNVGCAFIEATGGKALLAYEMGLGKTIMALAYAIKNNLRTVIICPASLKNNWCREVFKLSGEQANVLMGAQPGNHDLLTLLTAPSKFTIINYDLVGRKVEYDDVTVDTEGYKHIAHKEKFMWVDVLNMSKPDLVIFDESHYIKNTDSNRSQACRAIKSPRILHMTGTPVLNRPGELWPMLTMLSPDTFPSEDVFTRQYTYDGKAAKNVEELKEAIKPIMIRRRQSDVVADMPPLNRINDYHELSPKAKKLYNKVLAGVYEAIAAYSADGASRGESSITSILAKIQRLKMVCAIDKVDSTADLATQLHESKVESPHNKILIFTQYKAVAYAIAQRLGHEALCFVTRGRADFVTAENNERDRLVQQFQTDDTIKYLVVTEKTAKEGHNITAAGVVIFNDLFWTPAGHDQGEGRAFMRINDPHGIDSYYRITDMDGEGIEEWIWEMLKSKMRVINQTVEGVEGSRNTSIAMELISKMKDMMWSMKRK